ncbi:MAG: hypothetical protein U0T82_13070 [Bacteroidales bacterium]
MRVAVIDLGTNTWNILVAESRQDQSFEVLHDEKLPVKLAKGGMSKKIILPEAMDRGMQALRQHLETASRFGAQELEIIATSAFRTASNGEGFAQKILEETGHKVNIVSGNREAELIYKGVGASVNLREDPVLILDIGGGSNEFIIGNREKIFWKKSYKLGIARLLEHFTVSDPITPQEIFKFEYHFEETLSELIREFPSYHIDTLIGAAGSFETFASMLSFRHGDLYARSSKKSHTTIRLEDYKQLHRDLINSTSEERIKMPGLEPMRVEMIVLASVFVNFVIEKFGITRFIQTDYSLKEGRAAEICSL